MARSEANAVGNKKFPDLNMSHYPDKVDSRDNTKDGFNENMSGFTNLKHYNMAEHVNALADAVMAIQRTLGIHPEIDVDGQDHNTVDVRLDTLEKKNFDKRYGGPNWKPDTGVTLEEHKHVGKAGGPSKIHLKNEVQSELEKKNINLTSTGLTGADIRLTPEVSTPISDSITDKLSKSLGGEVRGNTLFHKKMGSMFHREFTSDDTLVGKSIVDYKTAMKVAKRVEGNKTETVWYDNLTSLQYGRYAIGVRMRINKAINESVLSITMINQGKGESKFINGTDLKVGEWKTVFAVHNVDGNGANDAFALAIYKLGTSTDVTVDFDYTFMTPVHPAIFDK